MYRTNLPYKSYLLRMWKETVEGDWRVTLQDVATGECHHFSDLAMMFVFLLEDSTDPDQPRPVLDTQSTLPELIRTAGGSKEALEHEGN